MNSSRANRNLVTKLVFVSVSMFAFGIFAMPPLYDKFCEITGIGQAGIRIAQAETLNLSDGAQESSRTVKVMFVATANSALPWEFQPMQRSKQVILGELEETSYMVNSLVENTTGGRAVYNVTPPEAARHFVKVECFCFSRQQLAGGEYREMPVRFYIEQDLPPEINEITLSYTFFLNEEPEDTETLANRTDSGSN